jgi:hypothetical protein
MALKYGTKETMIAKIASNLLAITGMKKVDRQHYEDFSNYEYPSCFVNDVRETREYVLKDLIKVLWTVVVVAFDMSESGDLSTKLNALLVKVKTAISADTTLNGQCYNVKIVSVDTDGGFMFPHCVGIFTLEIVYLEGGNG